MAWLKRWWKQMTCYHCCYTVEQKPLLKPCGAVMHPDIYFQGKLLSGSGLKYEERTCTHCGKVFIPDTYRD